MTEKRSDSRPPSAQSGLLFMSSAPESLPGNLASGLLIAPAPVIINPSPSQFGSDDIDAEADSFVGQTPPVVNTRMTPLSVFNPPNLDHRRAGQGEAFTLFKQTNIQHGDPFAQISRPTEYETFSKTTFGGDRGVLPDVRRSYQTSDQINAYSIQHLSNTSQPAQFESSHNNYRESGLASVSTKPESEQTNPYRISGKSQYAIPSSYMGQGSVGGMSYTTQPAQESAVGGSYVSHETQNSGIGLPYTNQASSGSLARDQYNYQVSDFSSVPNNAEFQALNDYTNASHSIHPPQLNIATSQPYQPTQQHWFYCTKVGSKDVWKPFNVGDSNQLEQVIKLNGQGGSIVSVDGGRYDVDVQQRERSAVYWTEPRSIVRRCSWFYQADGDKQFVPYDERFAVHLEECYKSTLLSGDFHKKLLCPGGETIVIHSPQVILHYAGAGELDAWGNTSNESRPKVVKRGIDDIEDVHESVSGQVDHLVLVVHGIGANTHVELDQLVECVNELRSVSNQIIRSHFKTPQSDHHQRIGWVEYLPVIWQQEMQANVADINSTLKSVTLKSIGKLRNFTNDSLLDILFYGSPLYSQRIVDAVSGELNRQYELFVSRNPLFSGHVSVVGHSLGAVILFDILKQQQSPETSANKRSLISQQVVSTSQKSSMGSSLAPSKTFPGETEQTLAGVLSQLGLSSFLEHFEREQIDLASLSLLEDNDIRDLGLPLGPRKKLQDFMKKLSEARAQNQASTSKTNLISQNADEIQVAYAIPNSEPLLRMSSETNVTYELCTGGVGTPFVNFLPLKFQPTTFFALGSPLAMFLAIRGITALGEDFVLPTCPGFYNIFHPFDPTAYRMEPMLISNCPQKPVLIPHHKGRKRLHLELRDSLTRMGSDLKQRIIESVKTTWRSINSFAMSHRSEAQNQEYLETQVDSVLCELSGDDDSSASGSNAGGASSDEDEFCSSKLNRSRRVDFVLQEKPIEIFNEYLFALGSHTCYWESEDTLLLMLKDIYSLIGVVPVTPSSNVTSLTSGMLPFGSLITSGPPPQSGFITNKAASARPAQGDHINRSSSGLVPPASHDYNYGNTGVLLPVIKSASSQEVIDGSEIEALNDSRSVPVASSRVRMLGPPLAPVIPVAPWQSVARPFAPTSGAHVQTLPSSTQPQGDFVKR